MTFATIDFTDAYTVDEASVLTVTSPKIAGVSVDLRTDNAWLMYDLGLGNEIGGTGSSGTLSARFEYTQQSARGMLITTISLILMGSGLGHVVMVVLMLSFASLKSVGALRPKSLGPRLLSWGRNTS